MEIAPLASAGKEELGTHRGTARAVRVTRLDISVSSSRNQHLWLRLNSTGQEWRARAAFFLLFAEENTAQEGNDAAHGGGAAVVVRRASCLVSGVAAASAAVVKVVKAAGDGLLTAEIPQGKRKESDIIGLTSAACQALPIQPGPHLTLCYSQTT